MQRISLTNTPAANATAVLTLSANATAGESVTIGAVLYNWVASLTAAFQVLVGASAAASLDNLKAAINHDAGEGSLYATGTTAHPNVTATTNTDTAQTIAAIFPGAALNTLATTETMSAGSWAHATMTGGADNADAVTLTAATAGTSVPIDNTIGTAPWRIDLAILALTAGKKARISFPDSLNAFGASLPGPSFSFLGPIATPIAVSITSKDYPDLRLGTASAVLRCNLDAISSAASITLAAAINCAEIPT